MTIGMDLELQGAVHAILAADPELLTYIHTPPAPPRIYQQPDPNKPFPYLTIGESTETDDSVQCLSASVVTFNINVWSRNPREDYVEVKTIANRVRRLLNDVDINLAENRCVQILWLITRNFKDPDGTTRQSVVTFQAQMEEDVREHTTIDVPTGGLGINTN